MGDGVAYIQDSQRASRWLPLGRNRTISAESAEEHNPLMITRYTQCKATARNVTAYLVEVPPERKAALVKLCHLCCTLLKGFEESMQKKKWIIVILWSLLLSSLTAKSLCAFEKQLDGRWEGRSLNQAAS